MAVKLDPCEGYSWPPKVSGVLNLTDKCTFISQSPGPKYLLPPLMGCDRHDPRSLYPRAPCVTMKGHHDKKVLNDSPGPIYFPLPLDKGPAYTIRSRPRNLQGQGGPGPAYMLKPIRPCNPGITMAGKGKDNRDDCGPGPAAYGLSPMMGCNHIPNRSNAPCYSISSRHKMVDRVGGPGPGTYNLRSDCTYMPCSPKYSLSTKTYPPEEGCNTPGPGTYCIERVRNFKEAPRYSFGIKWCEKVTSGVRAKKEDDDFNYKCPVTC